LAGEKTEENLRRDAFHDPDGQGTDEDGIRGDPAIPARPAEACRGDRHFFEDNKKRYCVLDFSDLEHKALKFLNDEEGGKSVRSRYSYIFVDECQDIYEIQDTLIMKLAEGSNRLYMAGDVKQNICRFRLANPKLFLEKKGRKGRK